MAANSVECPTRKPFWLELNRLFFLKIRICLLIDYFSNTLEIDGKREILSD